MGKKIIQETRGYSEERDETFFQRRKEEAFDYRYFPEPDLPPMTAKLLTYEGKITLPAERWVEFGRKFDLPWQYVDALIAEPKLAVLLEEVICATKDLSPKEIANAIINRRFGDPQKLGVKGLIKAIRMGKEKVRMPEAEVKKYIDKVILDNPEVVRDYKAGKEAALHFLLGMLMRETEGKIDPGTARTMFEERLRFE
jgi:aspartyl-tRNA(Asn)/glutamyl-tRNA(Gln) amidotransferase subunit B